VKGFVANTDYDWYRFLASRTDLDEVNFWQPSGGRAFRAVGPGDLFFFKLKRPHYAVAGFGVFWKHTVIPAWLAWETFAEANGAPDFETMRRRIERYRKAPRDAASGRYPIGCLLVVQPIFFSQDTWVPQPSDWGAQTVQGKTYDLTTGEGRKLLEACRERASTAWPIGVAANGQLAAEGERYGSEQVIRPRLGQGTFRLSVLDAYRGACAVTTEHSLPVLEASHIRPYSEGGTHDVSNGLLLRTDIHRLFDKGYVTVGSDDLRFGVSPRLRSEWENGREYYALQGARINVPSEPADQPTHELLAWHNANKFLS